MKASRRRGHDTGSVRIIGGQWRRHRLSVPATLEMRPTPDRVRETLFNWLEPQLPGAVCLDLFAGSGALGFEALSRGADHAVLVEHDVAAAAALDNMRATLAASAEVVRADARDFLEHYAGASFDIVFVDPPYAQAVDDLLECLRRVLKAGGCAYLERSREAPWPDSDRFVWRKKATAGAVSFGLATVD